MIEPATKYTSASRGRSCSTQPPYGAGRQCAARPPSPKAESTQIFIPRLGKEIRFDEWFWKELREGGVLCNYLARERYETARRYRAVARRNHGQQQNNKSDVRRLADVPMRDYLRWRATDQHFWEDNANLRSLRRNNSDVQVYL